MSLREISPGIFDKTEIYNIPKFIPALERPQPDIVNHNRPIIESFARHIHDEIVYKLLTLFAIILELPEDYFLKVHRYDEKSDCHLRYMKYHRRSNEENEKAAGIWSKGHRLRQPNSTLSPTSRCAAGSDSGGIHRVVAPPPDQRDVDRLGVLYFVRPEDDLELRPVCCWDYCWGVGED
ncbi:hypothetical protein N7486_000988 [Penicillium sp. IBT 16267x]|nr:hypothetical protein N7486_000988 [Penicillium sp. IBT 16267x]